MKKYVIPKFHTFLGILTSSLSLVIFVLEITINIWPESNWIMGRVFVTYLNSAFLNAVILTLMIYQVYLVLFALFRMKIVGFYSINSNQHTDAFSLCFSASLILRLGVPLCHNFLTFLKINGTVFQTFMGNMQNFPILGFHFQNFFPLVLIFFVTLNYFRIWTWIA